MRLLFTLILCLFFFACSEKQGKSPEIENSVTSDIVEVNEQDNIAVDLTNKEEGYYIDDEGRGFAYAVGLNGSQLATYSAQGSWQPLLNLPTSGTAEFKSSYALAGYKNASVSAAEEGYNLKADLLRRSGIVVLTANFSTASLFGSDDVISVSADIKGNSIDGAVYFDGMRASLTGRMDPDYLQGAFHSKSKNKVFAGGIQGWRSDSQ